GATASAALDNLRITASCAMPLPPTITKSFNLSTIATNSTSTLMLTITNPNSGVALSGVSVTDILPSGVTVTSGTVTPVCGGTLTRTAPSTLSFSGGTLAASAF